MVIDNFVIEEPMNQNTALPELNIQCIELDENQIQIRNKLKLIENALGPLSNTKP